PEIKNNESRSDRGQEVHKASSQLGIIEKSKTMTESSDDQSPLSAITDALDDLQATSRWQERVYKQIHAHPELSFQETKTAALAASKVKELGYEVLEGIGRTGVVGVLRNGQGQ